MSFKACFQHKINLSAKQAFHLTKLGFKELAAGICLENNQCEHLFTNCYEILLCKTITCSHFKCHKWCKVPEFWTILDILVHYAYHTFLFGFDRA